MKIHFYPYHSYTRDLDMRTNTEWITFKIGVDYHDSEKANSYLWQADMDYIKNELLHQVDEINKVLAHSVEKIDPVVIEPEDALDLFNNQEAEQIEELDWEDICI